MKKILIINGHPNKESFIHGLSTAYAKGAKQAGNEVQEIFVGDLQFAPNLAMGYQKRTALEPGLLKSWEQIKWAEHIVWVYPIWWGFMPAILKGFIDRVFLPGFAFAYKENSALWDKLLTGKTAHLINTMDSPIWYHKWLLGAPGTKVMKKMILGFVGIKTTQTTFITPIKGSTAAFREKWISKVEGLGQKMR